MLEPAEDGKRPHRRGMVVVDTDRTVRYRWTAEHHLDEWEISRIVRINEIIGAITAGDDDAGAATETATDGHEATATGEDDGDDHDPTDDPSAGD